MFPLMVLLWVFMNHQSQASIESVPPVDWSTLQSLPQNQRLVAAQTLIKEKIKLLPKSVSSANDITYAQVLFFLEGHLEDFIELGLPCKNPPEETQDALSRSTGKSASAQSLSKVYAEPLQSLINICCS